MAYQEFLAQGETAGEPEVFQHGNVDFDMIPVSSEELGENDRVLLDIRKGSEPCVLLAGQPFEDRVIRGMGRLITVDLAQGIRHERTLVEGEQNRIQVGTLYWYENDDRASSLIVQSTCPGFREENEPNLRDVAAALQSIIPIA